MYKLKEDVYLHFKNQKNAAYDMEISVGTLSRILNRKIGCSKALAFLIVKTYDESATVDLYFEKIK